MKRIAWHVCAFGAAGIAFVNLSRLVETSATYQVAWWKVAAFTLLFVMFTRNASKAKP